MYERMEEADALIESLMSDKDPNLRRSGMYTLAMAYCGTANNRAVKRLLHVAVSRGSTIRYGTTRHDIIPRRLPRCDKIRHDTTQYDMM